MKTETTPITISIDDLLDGIDDFPSLLGSAMDNEDDDLTLILARIAHAAGMLSVESDDPTEEDMSQDDMPREVLIVATQEHRLLCDGEIVAEWSRGAEGHYGNPDHPNTPFGEWTTEGDSDDQGGVLESVLDMIDPDGRAEWREAPHPSEPAEVKPETADDGEWCLWWVTTPSSDSYPLTGTRYESYRDARIAHAEAELGLRTKHRGTLLCGFGIGRLNGNGEWEQVEDDSE